MAYLIKRTVTRPNTTVAFFASNDSYKAKVDAAKTAGNMLSNSTSTSSNGLTLTSTTLWTSKAQADQFATDSTVSAFWNTRKAYYQTNGCVVTREDTEI